MQVLRQPYIRTRVHMALESSCIEYIFCLSLLIYIKFETELIFKQSWTALKVSLFRVFKTLLAFQQRNFQKLISNTTTNCRSATSNNVYYARLLEKWKI